MLLLSKLLMIKPLLSVLVNKTILLMNPCMFIGQQLDRIEEKIVERTVSIEKPVYEKSVNLPPTWLVL